jgi:general secretion pathway protein L
MPTSPTEPAETGTTLLRFAGGGEALSVEGAGGGAALAVPGTEVAIHWLDLAGDLTPAQAAAAARLMLADASAEPLDRMHVAAGRSEEGRTPVALVPLAHMAAWLADGFDPDLVVPEPLLLVPPERGLVRRGLDHRGRAAAFSAEPELAALLAGDAQIVEVDEAGFEAGLAAALAAPAINLRQGPFAKRRQWRIESGRLRRVAMLGLALALISLIVQLATIMRYSFAADRLEAELAALGPGPSADTRPGFGALAPLLFAAVRATPSLQLTRLDYRSDGSLAATVQVDNAATLAAFRTRIEDSGLAVEGGSLISAGGQPSAELLLRPA